MLQLSLQEVLIYRKGGIMFHYGIAEDVLVTNN
jgi:hypothetical protein